MSSFSKSSLNFSFRVSIKSSNKSKSFPLRLSKGRQEVYVAQILCEISFGEYGPHCGENVDFTLTWKILREIIRQTINDERESIENAFMEYFFFLFFNIYFNASNQHFSKEYSSLHLHSETIVILSMRKYANTIHKVFYFQLKVRIFIKIYSHWNMKLFWPIFTE